VIHDGSELSQWNYVPTNINPADDVSRGLTVEELLSNERWFRGPAFLWENKPSWLINPVSFANTSETQKSELEVKRITLPRWRKNDHWT